MNCDCGKKSTFVAVQARQIKNNKNNPNKCTKTTQNTTFDCHSKTDTLPASIDRGCRGAGAVVVAKDRPVVVVDTAKEELPVANTIKDN